MDKTAVQVKPEDVPDAAIQTVDWSCCCCSRRRGAVVLGVVYLALAFASLVQGIVVADDLNCAMDAVPDTMALQHGGACAVRSFHICLAVFGAIHIVANLTLLLGIHKRRPSLLLPWMGTYSAMVLFLAVAAVYCTVALSRPLPYYDLEGFFALVLLLAICLPLVYCILAVYTTYREMRGLSPQSLRWREVPPSPCCEATEGRSAFCALATPAATTAAYGTLGPTSDPRVATPPTPPNTPAPTSKHTDIVDETL